MRKLEAVVKSLTESIVFEYGREAGRTGAGPMDIPTLRAVCTTALRKALPAELELQRSEAVQSSMDAMAKRLLNRMEEM